jgi:hypothetical protein
MSRGSSPEDESKPLIPTGGALMNSGEYYGNSALGSVTYAPILEQLHTKSIPGAIEEVSASEKLESLVHECGVPPHKLPGMITLPICEYSSAQVIVYLQNFLRSYPRASIATP